MNRNRKYRYLQVFSLVNLVVMLILISAILTFFIIYYVSLPDNSLIREKLKIGKYISLFELDGLFRNYRNLALPIYELNINQKNLQKIYDNLPPSYSILTDEYKKYVKATFHFKGKEYKVKVRIRGLTPNHWQDKKKSWRIKFNSQNLFKGIKNIDLIIPQDRAYISEHLSNYIAKKMNLLVPDSGFAFLVINGKLQGIYFEIEHPGSANFLERHHRSDNANYYNDDNWNWFKFGFTPIYENICHWGKDASEKVSSFNDYADLNYLINLLKNSSDKQFFLNISNILNIEKFLTWQSHSMLMGSYHQGAHTNLNLYFDSVSGKFEPVPWDVHIWALEDLFFDKPYNPLVTRILKIPEFRHKRNLIIWKYINNAETLEEDLNFYDQTYKRVKKAFFVDRNKGFSNLRLKKEVQSQRNIIINNRKKIKDNLSFSKLLVTTHLEPLTVDSSLKFRPLATLDITNHGFSAAVLKEINLKLDTKHKNIGPIYLFFDRNSSGILDKGDVQISTFQFNRELLVSERIEKLLDSERNEQLKPIAKNYRFFIVTKSSLTEADLSDLKIIAKNAVTKEIIKPKYRYVDNQTFARFAEIAQTSDEFVKRYNLFIRSSTSSNKFKVKSGVHIINKTVIVPKGLQIFIQSGVTLKFAPGISFISYSPIKSLGNKDKPIVFTALKKGQPWGVFAVVGTDAKDNTFKNVVVEYGSEAFINGIYFTGALAIHAANVEIDNCIFRYNHGDDAINVKQGKGIIKNSFFYRNSSDAIDYDFASGRVENNLFIENKGDGIDLNNSHVTVVTNTIKQSGDKGISVGEESDPLIINNLIHSCVIGIGIKDNSNPQIINNTIAENEFGIKSFVKKEVFGGAKGKVKNVIIWGNNTSVELDSSSSLEVSNSLVQGGWEGENIWDIEPVFIDVTEENYIMGDSSKNKLLSKGAPDSHINELFPEFEDKSIPLGILFLSKLDFLQKTTAGK